MFHFTAPNEELQTALIYQEDSEEPFEILKRMLI